MLPGRSGKWIMHPVIVATELDFSGSIAGTVALADEVGIPACPAADPDGDPPVEGQERWQRMLTTDPTTSTPGRSS